MAKKLKLAKTLPKFADNEEAAKFFETHDISAIWEEFKPVPPLKLPDSQVRAIRERHASAVRKSIGCQTQLGGFCRERTSR